LVYHTGQWDSRFGLFQHEEQEALDPTLKLDDIEVNQESVLRVLRALRGEFFSALIPSQLNSKLPTRNSE
jgi:hypothetical protein